jgi:hypothetical protein
MAEDHICDAITCPPTGGYYVTAVDGPSWWKMAGPYQTHAEALADVDKARGITDKHDGRAWFMGWGTAHVKDGALLPGNLNRAGLI